MSNINRIFKNISFLIGSRVVTLCTGLISANFLGRYLGVEGFGKYRYSLTFVAIEALSSIIIFVVISVILNFSQFSLDIRFTIIIASLTAMIRSLASSFSTILRAYERFEFGSISTVLNGILLFIYWIEISAWPPCWE